MKSNIIFIAISVVIFGCSNHKQDVETENTQAENDSFTLKTYGRTFDDQVAYTTDSIMNAARHKALFDTVGLYKAPVNILSAKPIRVEYSNTRNVYLSYKNVSNKTISAIKFQWYGTDAFGDPADLGNSLVAGFGGGFTEDRIKPGGVDNGTWSIYSNNAKRIKLAWPTEVVFSDGTKWVIGQ